MFAQRDGGDRDGGDGEGSDGEGGDGCIDRGGGVLSDVLLLRANGGVHDALH